MSRNSKIRSIVRPSPALVVALLALTVSASGVSYAALKLKPNSVGAKQLKSNAVKSAKIADGAVGPAEIAAGSVDSSKVTDGSITRADAGRGAFVTAYARINNGPGASSVAGGTSVNVIDTDDLGADGTGNVIVTFNPSSLPGGSIATCSISVQPISLTSAGGITNLNAAVAVNAGGVLNADEAQVQTFNAAGGAADLDFFVQANCPPS